MLKKRTIGLLLVVLSIVFLAFPAMAASGTPYTVTGTQNYLAIRTVDYTSAQHEIGKLYNGDVFYVESRTSNNFAYGHSANGQYGYVNGRYLAYGAPSYSYNPPRYNPPRNNYNPPRYNPPRYSYNPPRNTYYQPNNYYAQGTPRTVTGTNNYLGLRTTPTRNDRDEIGRLYNGQSFRVLEFRNDGFAYGIAPNGQYGYVVSAYLR